MGRAANWTEQRATVIRLALIHAPRRVESQPGKRRYAARLGAGWHHGIMTGRRRMMQTSLLTGRPLWAWIEPLNPRIVAWGWCGSGTS